MHGYYEINKEETKIVKMIFGWITNNGFTLRSVVRKLQELKIKPRKSKREVWSTSTLTHLLRNKTYIGEAHYGKSYAVVPENPINKEKYRKMRKTSRKIRPEEEWIKIPAPAIIDVDLFMRAQSQLKVNFELSNRNKKNQYLLAGKMWCICGDRRTGEGPQHGKYLYYRCTNRVHSFPLPPKCVERGINTRIADTLIWGKISKLMSSPELLIEQVNRWLKQRSNKRQCAGVIVEDMMEEVGKLKEQEDRYSKAYGAGLFSIEKLKEYAIPIRERIAVIENQIREAGAEREGINEAALPNPHEVKAFAKRTTETLQNLNFETRRAIIMNTVEKIIGSQQELKVYGYIPVSNINYVGFKTIHRDCWFAECR